MDHQAFFRQMLGGQLSDTVPFSPQFDPAEFSRKPNPSAQASDSQVQEVASSLKTALTTGMYRFSGMSANVLAAQFKNSNMRQSPMSPEVIEVALTKIVEGLSDKYKEIADLCQLSYNDDGGGIYDDGVRVFAIQKK